MAFDAFATGRISFDNADIFQIDTINDASALMGALGRPAGGYVGQNVSNSIVIEHTQECCACGHDHGYELSIEKIGGTLDGVIVATPETDIAGDTTTTASIAIGGTFVDEIEVSGDEDWIAVDLVAGQEYVFTLTGTGTDPLDDPFLELMDASGTMIAENDDGGSGLNSRLRFTADASGTFYLNAHGWVNSQGGTPTGEYTLTADLYEGLADYTLDQAATFITDEFSTRSAYNNGLIVDGNQVIVYDVSALTAAQANLAVLAMEAWADITAIDFMTAAEAQAANGGTALAVDITYINTEDGAYNSNSTSSPVNGARIISSGTVNVNADWNNGNTAFDSYTYQTYLHEVGHALGLGHAGPYNGNGSYDVDALYAQDSWAYSVMSYFDQDESGYGDYRFVLGPQIVDVIAIQDLYGENPNGTRTGDSVYGFNSTETDVHNFSAFTRPPALTIYDTGGIDTLDMSGYSNAQVINLTPESFSDLGDRGGSDSYSSVISIARGTIIENAVGGGGSDLIIANDASNELTGNGGADTFRINVDGSDADTEVDTITDFIANVDKLDLSLFDETLARDAFNQRVDTAQGTQITIGSQTILLAGVASSSLDLADVVFQSVAVDTLPDASNDTIETSEGDTLTGSVFSDNGNGADTDADGDTLTVVSVQGSAAGVGGTFSLSEGATITINADGSFVFAPGEGYRYLTSSQSVTTQLTYSISDDDGNTSSAVATFRIVGEDPEPTAENDTLFGTNGRDSIDGLAGSDTINGLDGDDTLLGSEGDDTLNGGEGNDNLYGGAGIDTLNGGAGSDYLYVDASDTITGGTGYDTVILEDLYTAGINIDLGAAGIERIFATNVDDVLNAATSTTAVVLYGFGGADTLIGGAGSDYLYFDNDDIANGSLDGGAGFDYLLNNSSSSFTGTLTVDVASHNAEGYYGGAGTEIIDASGVTVSATIYTNGGADQVIGSANGDYIYIDAETASVDAGAGYDYIVYNQFDGSGANVVLGDYNAEGAVGRAGDDTFDATGNTIGASLYGAEGNDTLIGGTVTDYLYGDVGNDTLTGNEGYDYFVTYANWGDDTITDFTVGGDAVLFTIAGLTDFNQIGISQDGSDAIISYNGNTLRLTGVDSTTLTSSDFVISPPASSAEVQTASQAAFDFANVETDASDSTDVQMLTLITASNDAVLSNDINLVDVLLDPADVHLPDLFEVSDDGMWFISA